MLYLAAGGELDPLSGAVPKEDDLLAHYLALTKDTPPPPWWPAHPVPGLAMAVLVALLPARDAALGWRAIAAVLGGLTMLCIDESSVLRRAVDAQVLGTAPEDVGAETPTDPHPYT